MFSAAYIIEQGTDGFYTVTGPLDRFDPENHSKLYGASSIYFVNHNQAEAACAKRNLQHAIDKGIADKQMLTRPVTHRSYYSYLISKYEKLAPSV